MQAVASLPCVKIKCPKIVILFFGGTFWTKSEPFLNKIPTDCRASRLRRGFGGQARAKLNARASKKEGGWGEGIFARPRFPPPPNFVPVKNWRAAYFMQEIISSKSSFSGSDSLYSHILPRIILP